MLQVAKCTSPLYRIDLVKYPNVLPHWYSIKKNSDSVFIPKDQIPLLVESGFNVDYLQALPCRQCFSCRLNYSKEWAIRCQLESLYHEHSYFVTLTYDNDHLPSGKFLDYDHGIVDSTLCRSDVQKWLKRFRKAEKKEYGVDGIKVFYCGEYGELNGRPHYHALLFGTHEFDDLQLIKANGSVRHYSSDFLDSTWSDDLLGIHNRIGLSSISEFNFNTAAYTTRYMFKKQKGQSVKDLNSIYYDNNLSEHGIELRSNVFCGMSNRPGIGKKYYDEHKDEIYSADAVPYHKDYQVFLSKPPAYFDRLYDIDFPEAYENLKEERCRSGLINAHNDLIRFSEPADDRAKRLEDIAKRKAEKLNRTL